MNRFFLALCAAAPLVAAAPAAAQQSPFAAELRAGAGVGAFGQTGAGLQMSPGLSFGLSGEYALRPSLSLYAAYDRTSFGCDDGFCQDGDVDMTSDGFGAGVRLSSATLPMSPWLRAGLAMRMLDIQSDVGEPFDGSSDASLGFDVGAGVEMPLSGRLSLAPGLRYVRHSATFGEGSDDDGVAVISADVGLRLRF